MKWQFPDYHERIDFAIMPTIPKNFIAKFNLKRRTQLALTNRILLES